MPIRESNAAVERFAWGQIKWMYNASINPGAELTFGVVEIATGEHNAFHSHPNCEELLYVVSGRCTHIVGEEEHEMGAGDLVSIPRGVSHQALVKGDEPFKAVICYSSGERRTDTESEE